MANDPGSFTGPSSTAGDIFTVLGAFLGGGRNGGLGGGLSMLGQLFNNRAMEQFEISNRPKTLKLFKSHGLMNDKDVEYYSQLPTREWLPIQDSYQADLAKTGRQAPLQAVFDQKTGRETFVQPTPGMQLPEGEVTPSFYKKPGQAKIPTPVQALAMKMGGLNDLSELATRPDLISAASQAQFDQQKRAQADIAEKGREEYRRFAESFKPTAAQKAAEADATTTARLAATNRFVQQKPFNQVDKDHIPFIETRDGQEVPVPETLPYGQIAAHPKVFYVPKSALGVYPRLNALPAAGQQLVAAAPGAVGKGGVAGAIGQEIKRVRGAPAYSRYRTAGATYVDTVASTFSRRVSQQLIDNWKEAIYGPYATLDSVKSAVGEINKTAAEMKQSLRTKAAADVGASANDMLDKLAGSTATTLGATDSATPPPPPMISSPPPPPGFE